MPIGFFSPLPLAMMIPFMATQSLAMGEAFGKSFQYGKRKISSMTNEEFNKYTIKDMMAEQTADIRTLIPELTNQMAASSEMQSQIFSEMIKLVPAFINAIQRALTGAQTERDLDFGWQTAGAEEFVGTPGSQELDPNAQYYLDQNAGFQEVTLKKYTVGTSKYTYDQMKAMPTSQLQYKIDNELQGTAKSVAIGIIRNRPKDIKATGTLAPSLTDTVAEAQDFTRWQANLIKLQSDFLHSKEALSLPSSGGRDRSAHISRITAIITMIKRIANDYRNPNKGIRTAVLELRQEIANGSLRWK